MVVVVVYVSCPTQRCLSGCQTYGTRHPACVCYTCLCTCVMHVAACACCTCNLLCLALNAFVFFFFFFFLFSLLFLFGIPMSSLAIGTEQQPLVPFQPVIGPDR